MGRLARKLQRAYGLLHGGSVGRVGNVLLNHIERRFRRGRVWSYPTHLDVVLTKACNLNCVFCISGETVEDARWLPFDLYERIAGKLFPYARTLMFCSGGEPLLYTRIREALRIARCHGLRTGMVSNGMLLTDEVGRWLVADGSLAVYMVSLDGARKETVERIRRGASFDRIIDNVANLTRIKRDARSVFPRLSLRFAAMRSNIEELPEIFDLCKAVGIKKVLVNYLNVANGIDSRESLYFHEDITTQAFHEAMFRAREAGIQLELPPLPREGPQARCCSKPWSFCQIDADGSVRFCYKAWIQSLGTFDSGFDGIWRGEHYRKIRRSIETDSPYFLYCKYCSERRGLSHEESHNQRLHLDAYLIPGLEEYQTAFNRRQQESRAAFRKRARIQASRRGTTEEEHPPGPRGSSQAAKDPLLS